MRRHEIKGKEDRKPPIEPRQRTDDRNDTIVREDQGTKNWTGSTA